MSRIVKLQRLLRENNIDGLIVSNFYNIFYLTGFKTLTSEEREAWVLVTKNNTYLFTDGRYLNKSSEFPGQLGDQNSKLILKLIEPDKSIIFHLKKIVAEEKINSLGVEGEDLRVSEYDKLQKIFYDLKIIPTEKLIIKKLRKIKERQEIEKIKKSCQIADNCLKEITKLIKVGTSEKEIAFKIEFWLKEKGFDLAFYPIVAIGKNSSLPHYDTKNGNGKVGKNSVILIDFGVKYQDYNSDITRMVFVNPSSEVINIYEKLLSAQEKTINTVLARSDQNGKDIDNFCRKMISDYHLPNYPHSTGHGIGLEVHEYPKISQNSTDILRPGQVLTIEPGVYFEGKWGMRIEDTVWINNNFKVEVLTKFRKHPLVLKL